VGRTARLDDGALFTPSPTGRGGDLMRLLGQAGLWPDVLAERQQNLEEIFLQLTGTVQDTKGGVR
jgi:hypothetical protein